MKQYIAAGLMFFSVVAVAGFVDGNELSKWNPSVEKVMQRAASNEDYPDYYQFMGYTQGAYDANSYLLCPPDKFTTRQLMGVVSKYLKENPNRWNLSGGMLVYMAVSEAFPCQKPKK